MCVCGAGCVCDAGMSGCVCDAGMSSCVCDAGMSGEFGKIGLCMADEFGMVGVGVSGRSSKVEGLAGKIGIGLDIEVDVVGGWELREGIGPNREG